MERAGKAERMTGQDGRSISLDQLLNFRADALSGTADAWRAVAGSVAQHNAALRDDVRAHLDPVVWDGGGGDAARGHLDRLLEAASDHEERLRAVSDTLRNAHGGFSTAQSVLNQAVNLAREAGLEVGADGSVSWNPRQTVDLLTDPAAAVTIARMAEEIAGLIGRALDHACTVDKHTAAALAALSPRAWPRPMVSTRAQDDSPPSGIGRSDEEKLRQALQEPIDREAIDEVATELKLYKENQDFLTGFFGNGGGDDLARLAAALEKDDTRTQHTTLLSENSLGISFQDGNN